MPWSSPQTELLERTPEKKRERRTEHQKKALKLFVSVPCSSELASRSTPCHRFSSNCEKTGLIRQKPTELVIGKRDAEVFKTRPKRRLIARDHGLSGSPFQLLDSFYRARIRAT